MDNINQEQIDYLRGTIKNLNSQINKIEKRIKELESNDKD